MGDDVARKQFTRADRRAYQDKLRRCLDVFTRMVDEPGFDTTQRLTGMEIEFNLVDDHYEPAMRNTQVLSSISDAAFQTELGAYNIELNVPPRTLGHTQAQDLEAEVRASLNAAQRRAADGGTHIVMIGILPTIMPEHLRGRWMSRSSRYRILNDAIFAARGEDMQIDIAGGQIGGERLRVRSPTIAPESACTSTQLHVQVAPENFAAHWNAAQLLAGPQLALGANSPYFFGKQLWAETRIELFAQSTDTRSDELKAQGVRPRVWFGERWITSVCDLFEENVRHFPSLLPEISDEDPEAQLRSGRTPLLAELRLHNGTVYRWNRPVYDVVDGTPHLRVENRVLPAGPTIVDVMANAAFYYGVLRVLAEHDEPLWTKTEFAAAAVNFREGARRGMDARFFWPGIGDVAAGDLVLRHLLPMAHEGLRRWGVDPHVVDRYLGVIEGRAASGRNGAWWQTHTVAALSARGADRRDALVEMLRVYCDHMHANEPVHTWELPRT